MKKITIFYRKHHTSYRFAIITKKQIEDSKINIILDLVDLDTVSHIDYMLKTKENNKLPDIIYVWETENFGVEPISAIPCNVSKELLMNIYPDTHIKTYSYEDRVELEPDKMNDLAYNYLLAERIKNDLDILNDTKNYLTINKETLRIESHALKNKYWIEDYLYFHPYCEIVESKEKGTEILNIIVEERINTLQKEAEIIKREYKNRLRSLAIEIDKLKNISKKL